MNSLSSLCLIIIRSVTEVPKWMKAYNVLVRRAAPGSSRCFTLEQFLPIGDFARKVSARLSWRGESSLARDWLIAFLYLRKSRFIKNQYILRTVNTTLLGTPSCQCMLRVAISLRSYWWSATFSDARCRLAIYTNE